MSLMASFLLHSNSLSNRGDSVALMELARALLREGFPVALTFFRDDANNSEPRIVELRNIGVLVQPYGSKSDIERFCEEREVTHFVTFSDGTVRGNRYISEGSPGYRIGNTIHVTWAVFRTWEPHGDFYLYVSRWNFVQNLRRFCWLVLKKRLGMVSGVPKIGYAEHFLDVGQGDGTLFRAEHGLPPEAVVVGRIGGYDQFSDPVARQAVAEALDLRENLWFLFVSTEKFISHPRVVFVESLSRSQCWDFYDAVDFLLNGRLMGESFGFGVVEALRFGKPIIAPSPSRNRRMDKNHVRYLRGFGLLYRTKRHLVAKLVSGPHLRIPSRSLGRRVATTSSQVGIRNFLKALGVDAP